MFWYSVRLSRRKTVRPAAGTAADFTSGGAASSARGISRRHITTRPTRPTGRYAHRTRPKVAMKQVASFGMLCTPKSSARGEGSLTHTVGGSGDQIRSCVPSASDATDVIVVVDATRCNSLRSSFEVTRVCASRTSFNGKVHHGDTEARRKGEGKELDKMTGCSGFILLILFILSATSDDLPRRWGSDRCRGSKNACSTVESRCRSDITVCPSSLLPLLRASVTPW